MAASLIASQIDLTATQIHIDAANVQIDGETIISKAKKIKAALIEVEEIFARSITMRSGGSIQSDNYSTGSAGWKIDSNGNVEFNNGTFRGDIYATNGTFSGKLESVSGSFNGIRNVKGFNINGFLPGDIELLTIQYHQLGGVMLYAGTAYKCVGTGTFRCKLSCKDGSIQSTGDASYILKKKTELAFSASATLKTM